ncbi:SDR family oxidoreductase [Bowmanella denitrificans]|uniref:SDR family oxidoreductase n=1 Tax=Bowmanella denitrificans TaxID=366582 RepID=A0ABP3GVL9_9ALTE
MPAPTKRLILTGATGFVGKACLTHFQNLGYKVVALGRKAPLQCEDFIEKQINAEEEYKGVFCQGDVVIHCAARAHVMRDDAEEPLALYRQVNTAGTLNLAKQAEKAGVKRFIFLSSIKVNGESTQPGRPFCASDNRGPSDPYAISKAEAETGLLELAEHSQMEVVIIRPPLVYGPGVKANFASMIKLAKANLPLPLASVNNKRSMVSLPNLVSLIETCINHPNAANKVFLVSDNHDVSTSELLSTLTRLNGKKPRLWLFPVGLLKFAAGLVGKSAVTDRLCSNLQVNIADTINTLNWLPPVTFEQGLAECLQGTKHSQ